jgi:hypothetical protein
MLFRILIIFAISTQSVYAFQLQEREPPSAADKDCDNLAGAIIYGMRRGEIPAFAKGCNSHPDRLTCESMKAFLKENNFSNSMLTCDK